MECGKIVLDKIVVNKAGEDQIKLEQNTKGMWTAKIIHSCKTIGEGIRYLELIYPDVEKLIKVYNKEYTKENKK